MKQCLKGAVVALVFMLPSLASAGFVTIDDIHLGSNSIILDESSGLEWVKLDNTHLTSTELTELSVSGTWGRFRHATGSELQVLMEEAGILPNINCVAVNCNFMINNNASLAAIITNFINVFGSTGSDASHSWTDAGGHYDTSVFTISVSGTRYIMGAFDGCHTYNDCASSVPSDSGNWLIRTSASVPTPPTIGLLGFGLLLINWRRSPR